MKTKYYTSFSAVDDRFSLKRKGIFWCKDPQETLKITMTVVIDILALLIIYSVRIDLGFNLVNTILNLALSVLQIAAPIASVLILIGVIRVVLSGAKYSFTADDEKMMIVCPALDYRADIYYANVLNVEYKDMILFSKLRGYDVTIYCKDGTYCFPFLFPYKATIKNKDLTPFVIIEEHAGLLEKPEFLAGQRIDNTGIMKDR